ncbi:PrsW family intramembrane metalloprotease [Phormidium tenue FACHB-886]|nr:PrsW family intramembrane metalloprotease [Phormidium tenue FACHB-886]
MTDSNLPLTQSGSTSSNAGTDFTQPNAAPPDTAHLANAIATQFNQDLSPKGITVTVGAEANSLRVLLAAEPPPNQLETIGLICERLASFELGSLQIVKVLGQQFGTGAIAWEQTLDLSAASASTAPAAAEKRLRHLELLASLKTFKFSSVIPYKEAIRPDLYNSGVVRLLLFFSLFPWAVRFFAANVGLEQTAWILGIYYALIWGIVLRYLIKPRQFSWSNTLKCVGFTAFVGIPLLLLVQKVPLFDLLYAASDQRNWSLKLIGFVLGVGVLEEVCKALPVYLLLLRPGKLSDPLTAAFYGSMSGLGFAIAEGASYSVLYAFNLVEGELDFGGYVLLNTLRFISTPLFHAIWAGITGYFIGLAAINPSRQTPILIIGVAIAATLHGLYNTFAGDFLGLPVLAFSILLFVAYLRRSKQMVEEMVQAEQMAKPAADDQAV